MSEPRSRRADCTRASARWSSPPISSSTCRRGVRYALIGPNGAGKTTLINLMTGMLRPDAGRILLGDADITALPPDERVRRGLVRTFQINSLFPHLTALESVTLAVCERRRVAQTWWRQLTAYRHEIDEAYDILVGADARRRSAIARRANWPTASSACSRSRWRWRPSRRCCCSTSRRPACRATKARTCSPPSPGLSRDITVLFIEHDMDLVFRFASRVIVMVGGRVLVEGTPAEIAADPRVRAVYLGKTREQRMSRNGRHDRAAACAARHPRRLRPRRGARRRIVRSAGARQPRRARPQRRRQVDAASHHHGLYPGRPRPHPLARRGHHARGRRIAARAPASAGWRRSARFFRR